MKKRPSLEEVEKAIESFAPEEQKRLLRDLPKLLEIQQKDMALVALAEPSFSFWDNTDDAAYDAL